jgi:enoyl-CoA hydratase/carnithine racemase
MTERADSREQKGFPFEPSSTLKAKASRTKTACLSRQHTFKLRNDSATAPRLRPGASARNGQPQGMARRLLPRLAKGISCKPCTVVPKTSVAGMSEHLIFEVSEAVATIRLDRPEKLNAFTDEMLQAWLDALDRCQRDDDVRAIVITGTGRAFTTGGDIEGFGSSASQSPAAMRARVVGGIQRLPRKIAELDKPVIAALNGLATGGGLDIALACDIRFAAESATFAETYVRMGLIPGAGGAYFLPRVVGTSKALELLWSGDFVDAREAERIGLVNKVFPDATLMDETQKFARRVAAGAPLAVQLIKRVVRFGSDKDLATALEIAAANLPIARSSQDHREAIIAYKEKRRPSFKGK